MRTPPVALPLLLLAATSLPGCIAWEIRDELRTVNQRMGEVDALLIDTREDVRATEAEIVRTNALVAEVYAAMAQTNSHLAQTNQELDRVYAALETVDRRLVAVTDSVTTTNPLLTSTNSELERLRVLTDVNQQLDRTNTALKPLAGTMAALTDTMSFFGGGSDEPVTDDPEPGPGDRQTAGAPPTDSTPASDSAPAADTTRTPPASAPGEAPARRTDPITGTWILAYPAPRDAGEQPLADSSTPATNPQVIVLLADGRFLAAERGRQLIGGTWTRSGRTLSLTPEPSAGGEPAGAGAQRPPASEGQPAPGARAVTRELVSLGPRTLTLRDGNDLRVFVRP